MKKYLKLALQLLGRFIFYYLMLMLVIVVIMLIVAFAAWTVKVCEFAWLLWVLGFFSGWLTLDYYNRHQWEITSLVKGNGNGIK